MVVSAFSGHHRARGRRGRRPTNRDKGAASHDRQERRGRIST